MYFLIIKINVGILLVDTNIRSLENEKQDQDTLKYMFLS